MKRFAIVLALGLPLLAQDVPWQARLQYIEACSCDLFCPCYFNDHASHQGTGEHKCNFNNVARFAVGKHGDTDLTGIKVWLSGDLGSDWATKGQADWLVATFEPKTTKEQKDGVMAILTKIYPVKWTSVEMDTSEITWKISPDGKTAYAKLANGKGEVKLTRFGGTDAEKPAQISNVRYFGATWNSPFALYHSDHFYKGFGKSYQLHHANGFTITVESSSDGKRVVTKKSD
ncbi:MAG TPA: DUF1326 domain-containing protein [Bryobacteraceae bacterium]|nr:DUF1326 domain-containing protein [Bryobacteraceae bacterium]